MDFLKVLAILCFNFTLFQLLQSIIFKRFHSKIKINLKTTLPYAYDWVMVQEEERITNTA
jgi:hypothetical protein